MSKIDTPSTGRARHPSETGEHPDAQLEACAWISEALGEKYGCLAALDGKMRSRRP